jgi:hypothetical protein
MATSDNKPIRTFRLRGVKVAVFENKTEQGAYYKTALQRIYREGEEWKTTTSLGRDDLPVARLLLGRAWEFILDLESGATVSEHESVTQTDGDGHTWQKGRSKSWHRGKADSEQAPEPETT